uniref:Uncharacterized protein n=1 Tax=Vitis vinifera TaxID=29760 RepID=A5C3U4_VITVI|nr:hypothetical protein VITISV_009804 [Vitis vinifera]
MEAFKRFVILALVLVVAVVANGQGSICRMTQDGLTACKPSVEWAEPTPAFARLLCGHFQGRLAMSLLLQELRALALPGNRPEHGHAAPGQVQYRHLNPLLKPCMNE